MLNYRGRNVLVKKKIVVRAECEPQIQTKECVRLVLLSLRNEVASSDHLFPVVPGYCYHVLPGGEAT